MSITSIVSVIAALGGILLFTFSASTTQAEQFTNPIVEQRADPWIYKHTDRYYYFSSTVPEYDRLELRRASRRECFR